MIFKDTWIQEWILIVPCDVTRLYPYCTIVLNSDMCSCRDPSRVIRVHHRRQRKKTIIFEVSALIKIRTWNYSTSSQKRRTVETIIEAAPHLEDYWPWVVWIIDFMTIVVVTTLQQQQLCCPRKWPEWWMSHFMPLSTAPNSKWTAEPGISIKILHATISRKFQLK